MQFDFYKVATATPKVKVADVQYNCAQILQQIDSANQAGVELLVFPELSITAYTCSDLFLQEELLNAALHALKEIQNHTVQLDMLLFVGLPLRVDGNLYNCAVAINKGKILAIIPKMHLPNYTEFYEKRHFTGYQGENKYIEVGGQTILFGNKILLQEKTRKDIVVAAEICEDLWVPMAPSTNHANVGATILVNLSASNEIIGKTEYRRLLICAHAAKTIAAYLYANAGNGESTTDLIYAGHSMIVENGRLLKESNLFEDGLLITEIDLQKITHERQRLAYCNQNSSAYGYCKITFSAERGRADITQTISKTPFLLEDKIERTKRQQQIIRMQAYALKKRMEHIGAKTAVIGISGGLDSTLALLVTIKAFQLMQKPLHDITAITMPAFGTTSKTKQNAQKLMQLFNVNMQEIDIKGITLQHFKDIGKDANTYDVVYENTQARIRTLCLMNIANAQGGIVIGTGDLSELALGFATYNGDHMSMYSINSSIPKTLVKYLIESMATEFPKEIADVLYAILNTEISPELLPPNEDNIVQKTESIVGSYLLNDFFLYYFIRFAFTPQKILYLAEHAFHGEYSREELIFWLKNFYKRFFNNQFKRSCMPDCVKIGSVALSPRGDWRMPSDATVKIWLDALESL